MAIRKMIPCLICREIMSVDLGSAAVVCDECRDAVLMIRNLKKVDYTKPILDVAIVPLEGDVC